jgi:hypothetical protein
VQKVTGLLVSIEVVVVGLCLLASLHGIALHGGGGLTVNVLLFLVLCASAYVVIMKVRHSWIVHVALAVFCFMIAIGFPIYLPWFLREFVPIN